MRRTFIHRILLFLMLFLFSISQSYAQLNKARVDSLYTAYTKTPVDTNKVNLLVDIYREYSKFNSVQGLSYAREALELADRIGFLKGICDANTVLGDYFYEQLRYSEALKHYLRASLAGEKNKMYTQLSTIYNKMGIIYSNQGKDDLSLKYFLKVAKMAEEQNKPARMAVAYNNIGIAYKDLGRYTEAKSYYEKALKEFEKSGFKIGIASVNNGLGIICHLVGDDDAALVYYEKSMQNFRAINDTASESGILTNIGEVYNTRKEYAKALECYLKSLKVAESYKNDGFRLNAYDGLSEVYANMKNYERAFYYMNRHLALKDTISDEEGMRQVQEIEKRMENEKQEREIEILKQREEIQDLKVKSQSQKLQQSRIIIYSVAAALLVVLGLSFFLFKAYRQIQRTNIELAEKKKEIQDSINYARHIQEAMLPDVSLLGKYFPEGFGLYLPKDVVSGDFYWFNEYKGVMYLAVADCTGHGVPGAFMSMIGIDKLNQSLIDKQLEDPSELLSAMNISIKIALKQKDDQATSMDGMDIALCSYNKKTKILQFAGANRPLWLIRNGELIEFKPTKASIAGYTENSQVYESHTIQMQTGDTIYTFTDGIADQFGGPERKKFMTKRLKEALLSIHRMPMSQQEAAVEKIFRDWKGSLDQVDDILLLGLRI